MVIKEPSKASSLTASGLAAQGSLNWSGMSRSLAVRVCGIHCFQIYTHVLNRAVAGVKKPADLLIYLTSAMD
jgi:hypothetical protein